MQSLEDACEEADHLMKLVRRKPKSIPFLQQKKNGQSYFSIHNRLRRLYYEECTKSSSLPLPDLKSSSLLLEKLVAKDNLNTLIVNLYPGNKGYSLAMRQPGQSDSITETVRWPYQMDTFLSYLDNGELPFMLVDLLEETYPEVFYSGCIIAEVRDYRQSFPNYSCNTHHVLLQPTTQSVISDVNLLAAQSDLSNEEKLLLESELVLATQGPLCLDPRPSLVLFHSSANHQKNLLSTEPLRRCARKFSQVSVNRKRKLDQFTSHPQLSLLDAINRHRGKSTSSSSFQTRFHKKQVESVSLEVPKIPLELKLPPLETPPEGSVDVEKFAREVPWPLETADCTPQLIEEYVLEADRGTGQTYHIKISLFQRVSNLEYIGELYVDKDFRDGEKNGRTCRFPLGSRLQASHYIQQFSEIFTEEGRKSVKITHLVPGHQPRVTCTPGMRERDAKAQAQAKALARSTLAAVTSTTNPPNARSPVASSTNATVNSIVNNAAELTPGTTTSSSPNPLNAVSNNVNLVNALSSPPMTNNFTNILNSTLTAGLSPAVSNQHVQPVQPVVQLQAPIVDSSQTQLTQVKPPQQLQQTIQQAVQPQRQPTHQQPPPTQLRSQLENATKVGGRTITNPEIDALATSLMNSAQQFQQQQEKQQQQLQQQQLQQQLQQSAVTNTTVGVNSTKGSPNTLLGLLNNTPSAGGQKVRKMTLTNLLNSKVLTPSQQQQLQQKILQQQQQQQQRVSISALAAQLASPPANEGTLLQHSLTSPQIRFSSPNRVGLVQPGQEQVSQQSVNSMLPSFEVEVPNASGSGTVNVNVAVPAQFDVLDNNTSIPSQVTTVNSGTNAAVPLFDITPSNFNAAVTNFNSLSASNFNNTATVNTLTSPNSSTSTLNTATNFDLQSFVESALVSEGANNLVPNYEIAVSTAASLPNFEIRVPNVEDSATDMPNQVATSFELPVSNPTIENSAAVEEFLNQQTGSAPSYQISFPEINSFDAGNNTLTVQNSFDFNGASNFTTVPVTSKSVPVSSNAAALSGTSTSGPNLLGRILASGTASATIRRLSASASVASTSNSDSSSSTHGMSALSALLAGTPSADNPMPGSSNSLSCSTLLERLSASSATTSVVANPIGHPTPPPLQFAVPSPSKPPTTPNLPTNSPAASPVTPKSPAVAIASPLSSPPSQPPQVTNAGQGLTVSGVNLQGLNLASLQGAIGLPGLQNVQVSFPGISAPISLSLSVSSATPHIASATVVSSGGATGTVCDTSAVSSTPHTMVLTNSSLSVPVAQIMASNVKAVSGPTSIRGIAANSIQLQQGASGVLVGTLQRAKPQGLQAGKSNVLTGRPLQAAVLSSGQRKLPVSNTVTASIPGGSQVIFTQPQVVTAGGVATAVCDATAVSSAPHTMVLTNPNISLPVAQLMTGGVKAVSAQTGLRGITANSIQLQQGSGQAIQLTLQRGKTMQALQAGKANVLAGRQLQTAVLSSPQLTAGVQGGGSQVIFSQQQLHLLQKQGQFQQLHTLQQQPQQPQLQQKPAVLAAQLTAKRRRSSTADATTNK